MKKTYWVSFIALILIILIAAGCSNNQSGNEGSASINEKKENEETKTIHIAFNPGPYQDMFEQGARPVLEEKGYTIEISEFTEGIQPNVAVHRGELDANTHQHSMFMESINQRENLNNVALLQQPTPPMGLYSNHYDSLEDIESGAKVNVPNEPPNLLRALILFQDADLITINDDIDPLQASLNDILENPLDLDFIMTDPAQGPRALQDVDIAAIQGNYAVANGIQLTNALKLERVSEPNVVVITVAGDRKDEPFARDIIEAYESEQFRNYVLSNPDYEGYYLPPYFEQ